MEFSKHYYLQAEYQSTNASFPLEVGVARLRGMKEFLIFPYMENNMTISHQDCMQLCVNFHFVRFCKSQVGR